MFVVVVRVGKRGMAMRERRPCIVFVGGGAVADAVGAVCYRHSRSCVVDCSC